MNNKVYVGNLTEDTTDSDLKHAFIEYGVADVSLVVDKETGVSKCFAFVTLEDEDAAYDAMEEMDGVHIKGSPIKVNEARERRRFQNRQYNSHQNNDELRQAIYEAQGALQRLSNMLNSQQSKPKKKRPNLRSYHSNRDHYYDD